LINPSFFKAVPQIFLMCFPHDRSDANVTPRYVTSSDVLMFIKSLNHSLR
jgi:hypothetical protein